MHKLEFTNEIATLADKFAYLLDHYMASHDGYACETDDGKPIIIGGISVSIQNGELATINVSIGSARSKHTIEIKRFPNSTNTDWSIEDK